MASLSSPPVAACLHLRTRVGSLVDPVATSAALPTTTTGPSLDSATTTTAPSHLPAGCGNASYEQRRGRPDVSHGCGLPPRCVCCCCCSLLTDGCCCFPWRPWEVMHNR